MRRCVTSTVSYASALRVKTEAMSVRSCRAALSPCLPLHLMFGDRRSYSGSRRFDGFDLTEGRAESDEDRLDHCGSSLL